MKTHYTLLVISFFTILTDHISVLHAQETPINTYSEALGTTLFQEDFSTGINSWTNSAVSPTTAIWEYRGTNTSPNSDTGSIGSFNKNPSTQVLFNGPIQSATRSNGFVIFDSDFNDNGGIVGGVGNGPNPLPHNALLTSPNINLTSQTQVVLTLTHYLKMFDSQMIIEISDDNFLNNIDTVYNAKSFYDEDETSSTNEFLKINVSSMAGGANFKFRFRFTSTTSGQSSGYYFWMIDDIKIMEVPDFDLALKKIVLSPTGSSNVNTQSLAEYTGIPLSQASFDFGALVENIGSASMTNVSLSAIVSGPSSSTHSSTSTTLAAGSQDTLLLSTPFSSNGNTGNFKVNLLVTADSTDDLPLDNVLSDSLTVTANRYSRDNGGNLSGFSYTFSPGQSAPFVKYDILKKDTLEEIELAFFHGGSGSNLRTDINSIVEVGVWAVPSNGNLAQFDLSSNLPIVSIPFYVIDANTPLNQIFSIPIPPTVLDPAAARQVIVGYRLRSGYVTMARTIDEYPEFSSFMDFDGDGILDFTINFGFPFRLIFKTPASICANKSLNPSASVFEAAFNGSILLNTNTLSGTAPYTYSWSGPNGFTSFQKDLYGLSTPGTYTVKLTDADGCSSYNSFVLSNCVGLSITSTLTLTNNTVTVNADSGTAPYTFSWAGPNGFTSSTQTISITDSGQYIVTVTDGNGCVKLDTIDLEIDDFGTAYPLSYSQVLTNTFDLKVYPNPASNQVIIELPSEDEFYTTITDVLGKNVFVAKMEMGKLQVINTSALNRGIYWVKVEKNNHKKVARIILE